MVYKSMKDVPPSLKGIEPPITLAQANEIAAMADAIEKSDAEVESPWAVAISNFEKNHVKTATGWKKRVKAAEVMKTVDGKPRPASDFLVVEDPDKPSTWALPVKVNGKPDHRLMGGAFAALTKGYRGQKYEGPQKAEALRKLKALYKSEDMVLPSEAAARRTLGGRQFGLDDFLVYGRRDDPATWHLPVREDGKPDHALMCRAWEALHGGHRGRVYDGPLKELAVKRLRQLFRAEGMAIDEGFVEAFVEAITDDSLDGICWLVKNSFEQMMYPATADNVLPTESRRHVPHEVFMDHPRFGDSLVICDYGGPAVTYYMAGYEMADGLVTFEPKTEWRRVNLTWEFAEAEAQEVEFGEAASGQAVCLQEADDEATPLRMDVCLIRPGWGNKRDMNYYPAEMLKRSMAVFVDAKMFEKDHTDDKSNRDWVSTVESVKAVTEEGGVLATVVVHDDNFARRARALQAAGKLGLLECSILARGTARRGTVNGTSGKIVEKISEVRAVDWVTKAGAGGHAVSLEN